MEAVIRNGQTAEDMKIPSELLPGLPPLWETHDHEPPQR